MARTLLRAAAVLLLLLLGLERATRFVHAATSCATPAQTAGAQASGQCAAYAGVCSGVVGGTVWVPTGWSVDVLEARAITALTGGNQQSAIISPACLYDTYVIDCADIFFPCTEFERSDGGVEGVPHLPCLAACTSMWQSCATVFSALYAVIGAAMITTVGVPSCAGGATFQQDPQSPDVWGSSRMSALAAAWPAGYAGQLMYANASTNYTASDGEVVYNVTCYDPVAPTAVLNPATPAPTHTATGACTNGSIAVAATCATDTDVWVFPTVLGANESGESRFAAEMDACAELCLVQPGSLLGCGTTFTPACDADEFLLCVAGCASNATGLPGSPQWASALAAPYSRPCATCMGAWTQCTVTNCTTQCDDLESLECSACAVATCGVAFAACSGLNVAAALGVSTSAPTTPTASPTRKSSATVAKASYAAAAALLAALVAIEFESQH